MRRSPQEAEALLDALVDASRKKPTAAQVRGVEKHLTTWLEPARPRRGLRPRDALKGALVVAGFVGLGLASWSEVDGGAPARRDARSTIEDARTTFARHEAPLASGRSPGVLPSITAPPRPSRQTSDGEPRAPAPEHATESEVEFLRRTQTKLAVFPLEALAMAGEHAQRYPRGVLVQEREVIAIDALVRLGRRAEAEARAEAFRTAYPRSAHLSRLADLTEER